MNLSTIYGKRTSPWPARCCFAEVWAWLKMPRDTGGPAGQAPGQNPNMDPQMNGMQAAGQPSPMDRMFVSKAMQGSMAEVQLGQLTLQKSNNDAGEAVCPTDDR